MQKVPGQHSKLTRGVGQTKAWLFRATCSLCPTAYVENKSPRDPVALSLILHITQPLCLPTDPSITAWYKWRGCNFEEGGLPWLKVQTCPSPGAQQLRESVAISGDPLGNVDPPTCPTKPLSVALFSERQRRVLICRTETASVVFSRLPSVSMENVPASWRVHSEEKRDCLSCLTLDCSLNISGQSQVEKQAVAHLPCGSMGRARNSKETLGLERKRLHG